MKNGDKFTKEIAQLGKALKTAKRVLITAPGMADGDSLGAQLALKRMLAQRYPNIEAKIINEEPLPARYRFLPDAEQALTPENYKGDDQFDVGIIVDGGVDRAGRVRSLFEKCTTTTFIDHHSVSVDFPYDIRIVEENASSTTEIVYHISQDPHFRTKLDKEIGQHLYLGLIFDTGFFRHSNTTPEAMELAAKLIRLGFDFTRVGERGMLERTFSSLQLLAFTLSRCQLRAKGKIIWSSMTTETLNAFNAANDDREGIIDHMFLTRGIEAAVLFFELADGETKVSFRSQGGVDVARFAGSVTERGGGHSKASGALLAMPIDQAIEYVLGELEKVIHSLGA